MPPKKKAKKSATPKAKKKPVEPLQHLSQAREKAVKVLTKSDKNNNVNYDIEQNIREIRAILATNTEIFDRCMEYKRLSTNRDKVQFARVDFNTVQSKINRCDSDISSSSSSSSDVSSSDEDDDDCAVTRLVAYTILSKISFDMSYLTKPPPELERILPIHQMINKSNCKVFIDYSKLFESALLLHDDVPEPALAKIKDGLMDIQICLGKIDEWILEPKDNICFLEKTFGIDLSDCHRTTYVYKDEKVLLKQFTVSGRHQATFDISKKRDRERLTMFIEFLKMEEE